jgi:colanic acid biosynthesis glycosyl transferase WcaI
VREPRGEHAHVEPYFGAPKSSTAVAGRRRKPATTEEAAPD